MFEGADNFYEQLVIDFINSAQLENYSFCAILEAQPDVDFWTEMFLSQGEVPKFIFISKSKKGNDTTGVKQCLKFRDYACKMFVICLDSDYRYLLKDTSICVDNFILQTYTYAMDNHYCHYDRLNAVCRVACNHDNKIFDFKLFWERFSEKLYPLFIWYIYLKRNNLSGLSNGEFLDCINKCHEGVPSCDVQRNSQGIIDKLDEKCRSKVEELSARFINVNLGEVENDLNSLGVTKQNVFLFVRGHNILSLLHKIGGAVADEILNLEKKTCNGDAKRIEALYKDKISFPTALKEQSLSFSYPEILRLSNDIQKVIS